jgi:hypothetical protein
MASGAHDESCEHSIYGWPCRDCTVLTPDQAAYGERLRSVAFTFAGTRDGWHNGQTTTEFIREMKEDAKLADTEPVYAGPKSRWV